MTGKSAGGHATQGEWEERKEGQADGQFIHNVGMDGIFTENTDLCNLYVLVIIIAKMKHAKQMSLCLREDNLN